MPKEENEEPPNFEDFLAEINRPHRKLGLSREEFYRKPRYKIIRPPNTMPKPIKRALSCSIFGSLALILFLTARAYIQTKNEESLAVLILVSVSLVVLYFASRDSKSFDNEDDKQDENDE